MHRNLLQHEFRSRPLGGGALIGNAKVSPEKSGGAV
jgi:hypothetical protein